MEDFKQRWQTASQEAKERLLVMKPEVGALAHYIGARDEADAAPYFAPAIAAFALEVATLTRCDDEDAMICADLGLAAARSGEISPATGYHAWNVTVRVVEAWLNIALEEIDF